MTSSSWPRDETEQALHDAWQSEDDAKSMRTLARAVVCMPLPPQLAAATHGVRVQQYRPGEMPLPVVDGPTGPAVPVFTSYEEMVAAWGPQMGQVWAQIEFSQLLAQVGEDQRVVLNPGGHAAAVLHPEHLQRIVRLVRGELTIDAVRAGPTSKVLYGAPAAPRLDILRAVAHAAAMHPEIASAHAGQAQIEEPGTLPFVILGFRLHVPDATAALDDVAARVQEITGDPMPFYVLDDARVAASAMLTWLSSQPPLVAVD